MPNKDTNECRACLGEVEVDVKLGTIDESFDWRREFEAFGGFPVKDSEPQQLCLRCFEELHVCWKFRQRCGSVQARLVERLTLNLKEESSAVEFKEEATVERKRSPVRKVEKPSFDCPYCEGSRPKILSRIGLKKHFWRFHSEQKSVRCVYCYKLQFPEFQKDHEDKCNRRPGRRARSKGQKSAEPSIVCPTCGKMVKKMSLSGHIKSAHGDKPAESTFICDWCGHVNKTRACILRHIRETHLGISYQCELCPASFRKSSSLTIHRRKEHTEVYPLLRCKFCDYSTPINSNMYGHERTHMGEKGKTHRCEDCGKAFYFIDRLKRHMRSHSDDRPHVCEVCSAAFKTRKALGVHGQVHVKYKDYECPVCSKAYATNQQMRIHASKYHPEYALPPPGTVMKKFVSKELRTYSDLQKNNVFGTENQSL